MVEQAFSSQCHGAPATCPWGWTSKGRCCGAAAILKKIVRGRRCTWGGEGDGAPGDWGVRGAGPVAVVKEVVSSALAGSAHSRAPRSGVRAVHLQTTKSVLI